MTSQLNYILLMLTMLYSSQIYSDLQLGGFGIY